LGRGREGAPAKIMYPIVELDWNIPYNKEMEHSVQRNDIPTRHAHNDTDIALKKNFFLPWYVPRYVYKHMVVPPTASS
jgi:hypothetical protein